MSQPVVMTHELTKKYGEFTALDRLSITLDKGQILGFIGPNGAGKTTTIKILVGLARPTSGQAQIAGVNCVREARKIKHLVGYMPDTFGSYDNMRVREYLDFFGAAFKIPWQRRKHRRGAHDRARRRRGRAPALRRRTTTTTTAVDVTLQEQRPGAAARARSRPATIGTVAIPNVGDLVLVAFDHGRRQRPVVIGRLYDDEDRPPTSTTDEVVFRLPLAADDDKSVLAAIRNHPRRARPGTRARHRDAAQDHRADRRRHGHRDRRGQTSCASTSRAPAAARSGKSGSTTVVMDQDGDVTVESVRLGARSRPRAT